MNSIFVVTHVTELGHMHALPAIRKVQQYKIIFNFMHAPNKHVIMFMVEGAIQLSLICYHDERFKFLWVKKHLATSSYFSMVDRVFQSALCTRRTRNILNISQLQPLQSCSSPGPKCTNGCETPFIDWRSPYYDRIHK